jgi:hypothetical protein
MPRKLLELPPEVTRAFVRDMHAFFACGHHTIKADGIAVGTCSSSITPASCGITDVRRLFRAMKDDA